MAAWSKADRGLVVAVFAVLMEGLALCAAGETLISAFDVLDVNARGVVVGAGLTDLGVGFCKLDGLAFGADFIAVGVVF